MNKIGVVLLWLAVSVWAHDRHQSPDIIQNQDEFLTQVAFFKQRLKQRPGDPVSLSKLGVLYLNRAKATGLHGDYLLAEKTFLQLLERDPASKTGAMGVSFAMMGRHRFREALSHARQIGEAYPGDPHLWALMGDLHFALGNYLEAETFYLRYFERDQGLGGHARMAQIAEVRGKFTAAELYFKQALALGEKNKASPHQLAWCHTMLGDLNMALDRPGQAEDHFRRALALDSSTHYAHWRLGQIAFLAGDFPMAQSESEAAVVLAPHQPAYDFSLGETLLAMGREQDAVRWFAMGEQQILAEIEAGDLGHIRELANHWARREKKLGRALDLAKRDLELRHDAEAHELAGWLLFLNGRPEEAVSMIEAALRPGTAHARTLLRAGIVLYDAGAKFRARQWLHKGLERGGMVDPDLRNRAQKIFDHLKAHPEEILPVVKKSPKP